MGSVTHFDLAIIGCGSTRSLTSASRSTGSRSSKGTFGASASTSGASRPRCSCTRPTWPPPSRTPARLGVDLTLEGVRWREIRDRIFRRIDPISVAGRTTVPNGSRTSRCSRDARFTGTPHDRHGHRGDDHRRPGGARGRQPNVVPDIPGLAEVDHHTSDTIMRIDTLPERLAIIGGGFVAAEFAHVFGSFGTAVAILSRSDALLRGEDEEVSAGFTALARERWDVRLDTTAEKVEEYDGGIRLRLDTDGVAETLDVDMVLVATGRRSNSDGLALDLAGVEVDEDGLVVVDEHQRTTAEGVWALGDVSNRFRSSTCRKRRGPGGPAQPALRIDRPRGDGHEQPRGGAERGVHLTPDRLRRADRAGGAGAGAALRHGASVLRRHGVRLGHGGHDGLREGARRPRHRAASRRAPHGSPKTST